MMKSFIKSIPKMSGSYLKYQQNTIKYVIFTSSSKNCFGFNYNITQVTEYQRNYPRKR